MDELPTRVAEVTWMFWVIKVVTTGMGETASDFLVDKIDPVLAVLAASVVLGALLIAQLASARFRHWLYWSVVAMVSVVGTMAADVLHIVVGVGYEAATASFICTTAAIFAVWYMTHSTIAVHSITTRSREAFYWAAVASTFALGTAVGDLTASSLGLGYLGSGLVFAVLFAVPALAYRFGMPAVPAFWCAYVLTRPFGASFADWAAVSPARGGLGLGTGAVTAVLVLVIVVVVWIARPRTAAQTPHKAVEAGLIG